MSVGDDIFETAPWLRTTDAAWRRRQAALQLGRAASINDLVKALRSETGEVIPWVDPFCGGSEARVLLVALRPGPRGAMASEFLSLANDDHTARNTIAAMAGAGLRYQDFAFWNTVPWPGSIKEPISVPMIRRGATMLERLLPLLPDLRAILLLGRVAQRLRPLVSWPRGVSIIDSPHTSPLAFNQSHQRERVYSAFREAAKAIVDPSS